MLASFASFASFALLNTCLTGTEEKEHFDRHRNDGILYPMQDMN